LTDREQVAGFERIALPHLKAAYELARWLTRDEHDAEDVMQEAYLRAFKYFEGFNGSDARTWLLAIVRNTFYTWREKESVRESGMSIDDLSGLEEAGGATLVASADERPDARLLRSADRLVVDNAIRALPVEFREVIVMRELEGLSYKQIASVAGIPLGTVMSRIARGREHLRRLLSQEIQERAKS
jgi:RNA polymerase sigma-70 factor (ECF subfamily)